MNDTEKTGVAIPESEADKLLYETLKPTNLQIIDEIDGLVSQAEKKLIELQIANCHLQPNNPKYKSPCQALEEIDKFKTTLRELKKVFIGD